MSGKETDFYVRYVRKHIEILLKIGCHVILVFDGQPLPAKKDINDARKALREKNQKLGEKLLKEGLRGEAHRAFQQGITITRDIVENTIRAFQHIPMVDIIVAPYEADAQIAYLLQNDLAYAAVTEDSDLIVFGCERIIFKMDLSGSCLIYDKSKLASCICPAIERRFEFEIFRRICILAGCDYLQGGLQGIGLKKAETFFTKTTQSDLGVILPRLPLYLNMSSVKVDKLFIEEFIKAENTFLYQIVFDPITRRHTTLNPYPTLNDGLTDADDASNSMCMVSVSQKSKFWYAGEVSPPNEAFRRALGNVDFSRAPVQDEFVLPITPPEWSVWSGERFLKVQASERAQRDRVSYEKFGAFAPKRSPKRVRKDAHLNAPLHSSMPPNSSKKLAMKRIPLIDVENEAREILHDDDEDDDENCLIFRKRKLQRRSEPMEIKNSASTRQLRTERKKSLASTMTQQNGTTLKWSSNEWMIMYGAEIVNNPKTVDITLLSDLSGRDGIQSIKEDMQQNLISESPSASNPALNPFLLKDVIASSEAAKSNVDVKEMATDSIEASFLEETLTANTIEDVEHCAISQRIQFQKYGGCRIGGLRQIRRPLVDILASSSSQLSSSELCSSGSISSSGVSSHRSSSSVNSQTSSSSTTLNNCQSPASPLLDDEFTNKRVFKSVGTKICSVDDVLLGIPANVNGESDEGKGDSCPNENCEPLNKENSPPLFNVKEVETRSIHNNNSVAVGKDLESVITGGSKLSPYFTDNKLINIAKIDASGYRPSGLRRRATPASSFPRVL